MKLAGGLGGIVDEKGVGLWLLLGPNVWLGLGWLEGWLNGWLLGLEDACDKG